MWAYMAYMECLGIGQLFMRHLKVPTPHFVRTFKNGTLSHIPSYSKPQKPGTWSSSALGAVKFPRRSSERAPRAETPLADDRGAYRNRHQMLRKGVPDSREMPERVTWLPACSSGHEAGGEKKHDVDWCYMLFRSV